MRPWSALLLLLLLALGAPSTHADGAPAPPLVQLYGSHLEWTVTRPGQVSARIWDGPNVIGRGQAEAVAAGAVTIPVLSVDGARRPVVIRPGHRLELSGPDGDFEVPSIPLVFADVDAECRQAVVVAPPGELRLVLRRPEGEVVVDRSGTVGATPLQLDLSDAELRPGDRGELTWRDPSLGAYRLPIGSSAALLRWDVQRVEGVGTAGSSIGITVTGADGHVKGDGQAADIVTSTWAASLRLSTPLARGDRMTIHWGDRLVDGAPDVQAVALPPLSLDVRSTSPIVSGTGPPRTVLELSVRRPDGSLGRRQVETDDAGRFSVVAPADVVPGTHLALDCVVAPEVTVRREVDVARLNVALATHLVSIDGGAGSTATVSHQAHGRPEAKVSRRLPRDGRATLELPGKIAAGDLIEYSMDDGPRSRLVVARVTAIVDVLGGEVTGEAPPGAGVTCMRFGAAGNESIGWAEADDAGRYRIETSGDSAPTPGDNGVVVVDVDGGQLYRTWSVPRLAARLGSQHVTGNPGGGCDVVVTLRDGHGRWRADGAATMSASDLHPFLGFAGTWAIALRGRDGLPVMVAPGDDLAFDADGVAARVAVPAIEVRPDPTSDTITGTAAANAPIEIAIERAVEGRVVARASASTHAADDGAYACTVAGFDLRAGDAVEVTVTTAAGHRVSAGAFAPWLSLRMDLGALGGGLPPGAELDAEMRRDGRTIATARCVADEKGALAGRFAVGQGGWIAARAGDEIVAVCPACPGDGRFQFVVPDLSLGWDLEADVVSGTANPGADVVVLYEIESVSGSSKAGAQTVAGDDGRWSVALHPAGGRLHLAPGSRVQVWEMLASGHRVGLLRTVPAIDVGLDAGTVRVDGDPLAAVRLEALDSSGSVIATAAGETDADGLFEGWLAGSGSTGMIPPPGSALRASIGDLASSAVVPAFALRTTWTPVTVAEIEGAPGQLVEVWTLPGCRPVDVEAREPLLRRALDAAGRLAIAGGGAAGPGTRHEFGVTDALWRFHRLAVRPLLILEQGTSTVSGCAPPLAMVSVTLRDATGIDLAAGAAASASDGRFAIELAGADGAPVPVRKGDVADFATPGDTARVEAEELWLHRQADGSFTGGGAPERDVALVFELADGGRRRAALRAGSEGEFSFSRLDLPAAADWSPETAQRAWAYMALTGDHFTGVPAVPAPDAGGAPRQVLLPMCLSSR